MKVTHFFLNLSASRRTFMLPEMSRVDIAHHDGSGHESSSFCSLVLVDEYLSTPRPSGPNCEEKSSLKNELTDDS